MSEESVLRNISSARELLSVAELTGVRVYEVHGCRVEPGKHAEDEPQSAPDVMARGTEASIETRMRLAIHTVDAELLADIGVEYTLSEPCSVGESVMQEFLTRVGAMAVFPFVRESIFATASRLGIDAPVLGLLRAGSFEVGSPPRVGNSIGADATASGETSTPIAVAADIGVPARAIRAWLRDQGVEHSPGGRWEITSDQVDALRRHFRSREVGQAHQN